MDILINILLSVLSGGLLALAFPKFDLYWLAWVALAPFFLAFIRSRGWRSGMLCGLFFGLSFFGIHLFWLTTLFRFVQEWVFLGWGALVLFQTLFILLFVVLARFLRAGKSIFFPFIVASVWIFVEWLRGLGPFGLSAGGIGYSQACFTPLIQIASLTSVYGISFLLVLVNAALADFCLQRTKASVAFLGVSLILAAGCYGFGLHVMRSPVGADPLVKVALLQPNIDQQDKLLADKASDIFKVHEAMTWQAIRQKPDIIIWPETAVFTYLLRDQRFLPRMQTLAREGGAWIIFGTPHYTGNKTYNSIACMSPAGKIVSRYDKQHLVPFGEYLPFRAMLYPLLGRVGYYEGEFNSNPRPEPLLAKKLRIAAAICFESTFPELIRERVKNNSSFILLVTNDAWFGDSAALYFHLYTGIFRAVENRKYFVQAANTGISAVIDPYGRIVRQGRVNQREILTFEIPSP